MEKPTKKIAVINYTEFPGPRYCNQGNNSGEDYYHKILNTAFHEAFHENVDLEITLDGVAGYASSFLDEAFGNLVYDFTQDLIISKLKIISNEEPDWEEMILNEIIPDWEKRRKNAEVPKKTEIHEPWYKFINGHIIRSL